MNFMKSLLVSTLLVSSVSFAAPMSDADLAKVNATVDRLIQEGGNDAPFMVDLDFDSITVNDETQLVDSLFASISVDGLPANAKGGLSLQNGEFTLNIGGDANYGQILTMFGVPAEQGDQMVDAYISQILPEVEKTVSQIESEGHEVEYSVSKNKKGLKANLVIIPSQAQATSIKSIQVLVEINKETKEANAEMNAVFNANSQASQDAQEALTEIVNDLKLGNEPSEESGDKLGTAIEEMTKDLEILD